MLTTAVAEGVVIRQFVRELSRHPIPHISILGHKAVSDEEVILTIEKAVPGKQSSHDLLIAGGAKKRILFLSEIGKNACLKLG